MKQSVTLILITLVWLTGCGHNVLRYNSSAVDYLYPEKDGFIETTGLPHLHLPIKVGIAFVPDNQEMGSNRRLGMWAGGIDRGDEAVLSETDKSALLEKVGQRFETFDFIEII